MEWYLTHDFQVLLKTNNAWKKEIEEIQQELITVTLELWYYGTWSNADKLILEMTKRQEAIREL